MRVEFFSRDGPCRQRPNVVLVMADDQGWGDTGYNGHPELKTPQPRRTGEERAALQPLLHGALQLLADARQRHDRAASESLRHIQSGRADPRAGADRREGVAIRRLRDGALRQMASQRQERRQEHHGRFRAAPSWPTIRCRPARWASTNGSPPTTSSISIRCSGRNGVPEKFHGDSSDVTTDEALKFIRRQAAAGKPFLAVVWFGSPHVPHEALPADKAAYSTLPEKDQNYYGEITAVDRSVGRLRAALRELKVADNTLLWYCSDNGGAAGPKSTGNLRGSKGTLWEGGLRVPGIVEWPARIAKPFISETPCSTLDIYPTVLEATGARGAEPDPAARRDQPAPACSIARPRRARRRFRSGTTPANSPATPRCSTGRTSCTSNAVAGRDRKGKSSRRSASGGAALRRFQRPEGNHRPRRAGTGARGEDDRRAGSLEGLRREEPRRRRLRADA